MAVERRTAVFLDRDGTIIEDRRYLGDPAGVELLPGAADAIARLNEAGFPVIVVTNQSGIGRGYFGEPEYRAVQARLGELLEKSGARVDASYHCPHAPRASPACCCRKPLPGLFERAAAEHRLDLYRSVYIGDRVRDVLPGVSLGGEGYILRPDGARTGDVPPRLHTARSLAEAVDKLLARPRFD
ncbi:MAG: HAD family hydrolase [Gemmatimonadota bacterium]